MDPCPKWPGWAVPALVDANQKLAVGRTRGENQQKTHPLGWAQAAQSPIPLQQHSHQNCTTLQAVCENEGACSKGELPPPPPDYLSVQTRTRPLLCLCSRGHCSAGWGRAFRQPLGTAAGSNTGRFQESLKKQNRNKNKTNTERHEKPERLPFLQLEGVLLPFQDCFGPGLLWEQLEHKAPICCSQHFASFIQMCANHRDDCQKQMQPPPSTCEPIPLF